MAGGQSSDSVELLYLADINSGWVISPTMPTVTTYATMVQFQNSVIVAGGEGGADGVHLYRLSAPDGSWEELEQTLKERRAEHVAFLVPDDLVSCY